MKPRLRVHIVPIGFEVKRAVGPLLALSADRAILVTRAHDDDAAEYLAAIKAELKSCGLPFTVRERSIWDVSKMVKEALSIANEHSDDDVFFNASTGATTARIAGTLASMFANIQPYYQAVDYSKKDEPLKGDYPCKGDPALIPTFRAPELSSAVLHTLMVVAGATDPLSKKTLLDKMEAQHALSIRATATYRQQALHGQIDGILDKLQDLDYVIVTGRRREKRIRATEKGRAAAVMLGPLLEKSYPS